jgi:hypothetical protein
MKSTQSLLTQNREQDAEISAAEQATVSQNPQKTSPPEEGSPPDEVSPTAPKESAQDESVTASVVEKLEQRLQDTRRWANKAHEDKAKLYKKLQALAEEGHVDLDDFKEIEAPATDPLGDFWSTVETQIQGYTESFGTNEPRQYLSSFKTYLRDLASEEPEKFTQLEAELSLLPSREWVKFVMSKGKAYFEDYTQHLEGKSAKERIKELMAANEKLQKQLNRDIEEQDTESSSLSQERPLLKGSGRQEEDHVDPGLVATDHILDVYRSQAIRS